MYEKGMSWRGSDSGTSTKTPLQDAQEWAHKHRAWAEKKAHNPASVKFHADAAERFEQKAKELSADEPSKGYRNLAHKESKRTK